MATGGTTGHETPGGADDKYVARSDAMRTSGKSRYSGWTIRLTLRALAVFDAVGPGTSPVPSPGARATYQGDCVWELFLREAVMVPKMVRLAAAVDDSHAAAQIDAMLSEVQGGSDGPLPELSIALLDPRSAILQLPTDRDSDLALLV